MNFNYDWIKPYVEEIDIELARDIENFEIGASSGVLFINLESLDNAYNSLVGRINSCDDLDIDSVGMTVSITLSVVKEAYLIYKSKLES